MSQRREINEPPLMEQVLTFRKWKEEALAAGEDEINATLIARHKHQVWLEKYAKDNGGDVAVGDAYEP